MRVKNGLILVVVPRAAAHPVPRTAGHAMLVSWCVAG
jgi:hypothetical protein